MTSMNAFTGNAFEVVSLSAAIERAPYVPSYLGSMGLFTPMPQETHDVMIDRQNSELRLIQTTDIHAPVKDRPQRGRDAKLLQMVHLGEGFTLMAASVQSIRAHGRRSELENASIKFLQEMALVRADLELTEEYHRLGAVQGLLLDADGTTVIYDFFDEMGEAEEAVVNFALNDPATDVYAKSRGVARSMARSSGGAFTSATTVHALCGDGFYDKLIGHANVKEFYQNTVRASQLENASSAVFESFRIGGITYHNYRGTDDNTAVAIAEDEAKFFPRGAQGVFAKPQGPHTTFDTVNTPGLPVYAERKFENEVNPGNSKWVRGELHAYNLHMCMKPRTLRKGIAF